jgi:hypothetical protein
MPQNLISPRGFLKERRPEKFSDSVSQEVPALDRSLLEYHLESLTSRGQEYDFENFARRLAELEICPNLLPHTGPTGGGDSKVDSETFPVSDALSLVWFTGIGREAANERWRPKVEADVAKIVATNRDYQKIFFVTNQFVSDRIHAEVEDELREKHGPDIRILNRTWILDCVFSNKREALAIEELIFPLQKISSIRKCRTTDHCPRLARQALIRSCRQLIRNLLHRSVLASAQQFSPRDH